MFVPETNGFAEMAGCRLSGVLEITGDAMRIPTLGRTKRPSLFIETIFLDRKVAPPHEHVV